MCFEFFEYNQNSNIYHQKSFILFLEVVVRKQWMQLVVNGLHIYRRQGTLVVLQSKQFIQHVVLEFVDYYLKNNKIVMLMQVVCQTKKIFYTKEKTCLCCLNVAVSIKIFHAVQCVKSRIRPRQSTKLVSILNKVLLWVCVSGEVNTCGIRMMWLS